MKSIKRREIVMNLDVTPLFPSLLFQTVLEPFPQQKLMEIAYAVKEQHQSVDVSNVGGYHSPSIQLEIEPLNNILTELVDTSYTINNMWFVINSNSHYNTLHNHPQSDLSGVLYITDSDCPIEFEHPQYFEQYTLIKSYRNDQQLVHQVMPQAGKLLLFPSALRHRVLPNDSKQDRISLSFNISLNK